MRGGKVRCDDTKPVPLSMAEAAAFQVREGDVFIVRGNGAKHLVGRAGKAAETRPGVIFPDLFIRVPLDHHVLDPDYFVSVWNSPRMRTKIEEAAKTTSGIWKINQGHIAAMSIPVPPLAEQRRIVGYLQGIQSKVDTLRRHQAETGAELDALLPAILDKAFKGEL